MTLGSTAVQKGNFFPKSSSYPSAYFENVTLQKILIKRFHLLIKQVFYYTTYNKTMFFCHRNGHLLHRKSVSYKFQGISQDLIKGELQRENKLISYERAFKMLENDMYIAEIGQVVLELLSFKVESGNHRRRISLLQKFSDIFGNMRLVPLKMTSQLTSHNFQILKIEIFSKLCKI